MSPRAAAVHGQVHGMSLQFTVKVKAWGFAVHGQVHGVSLQETAAEAEQGSSVKRCAVTEEGVQLQLQQHTVMP
jgi:hypothetical protein